MIYGGADIISKIYHPFRKERISLERKTPSSIDEGVFFSGAPGGIRTLDLPVRSRALYPLSYKRIPYFVVVRSTALTF